MQDDQKTDPTPANEESLVEEESSQDTDTTATDESASPEGETVSQEELDPWEQLEQEALKWKDAAMRSSAELENFRKRMVREKQDAIRYGNQRLIEELLPVIDNFQMGMMAASQEQDSMIYMGMNMVQKQLTDFLESQGVKEVEAEGKVFDPNIHEAISQEDSEDHEEGQIIRAQRKGYMISDRLIRPAAVVVAKGADTETTDEEAVKSSEG